MGKHLEKKLKQKEIRTWVLETKVFPEIEENPTKSTAVIAEEKLLFHLNQTEQGQFIAEIAIRKRKGTKY